MITHQHPSQKKTTAIFPPKEKQWKGRIPSQRRHELEVHQDSVTSNVHLRGFADSRSTVLFHQVSFFPVKWQVGPTLRKDLLLSFHNTAVCANLSEVGDGHSWLRLLREELKHQEGPSC